MNPASKGIEVYLSDYHAFESNGASGAPSWLRHLRSEAIGIFSGLGFPTTGHEDWRFTNISPLTKVPFRRPADGTRRSIGREHVSAFIAPGAAQSVLVFVNGMFDEYLSNVAVLPPEIVATNLAHALDIDGENLVRYLGKALPLRDRPFAALNTAFIHDGGYIRVPKNIGVMSPIQMLFVSAEVRGGNPATYPRNLVILEDGASASVVESYVSLDEDVHFTNAVTEFFAAEGAAADVIKIQGESENAYHIGTMQVVQSAHSRVTAFSLALGGAIARNDMGIAVDGSECETMLDGIYVPTNSQLIDHHTNIDHRQPNCSSREVFKGIVSGESRSVFNGKIFVRREAQKTDSKQTNKNLLLSEKATVDTKPQLEIFADDVKCTHGATVGGLDAASLFYMKSRGISEEAARALLTVGFASEVTNYINNESLRRYVDGLIIFRLQEKVIKTALPEIVHSEGRPA